IRLLLLREPVPSPVMREADQPATAERVIRRAYSGTRRGGTTMSGVEEVRGRICAAGEMARRGPAPSAPARALPTRRRSRAIRDFVAGGDGRARQASIGWDARGR